MRNNNQSDNVISALSFMLELDDDKKHEVLKKLFPAFEGYILKQEIYNRIAKDYSECIYPHVKDQIAAIDARTERAVNKILDAATHISDIIRDAPPALQESIQKEINHIFEGCNFQDLVSQHANEINLIFKNYLDVNFRYIQETSADLADNASPSYRLLGDKAQDGEEGLLNGPSVVVV